MTMDSSPPRPRVQKLDSVDPTGGYDEILTWPNGRVCFLRNGELHRDDGAACIGADGEMSWLRHGREHREDGPAVVFADGTGQWWIDGKQLTDPPLAATDSGPEATKRP
jgi:hypothetical protein